MPPLDDVLSIPGNDYVLGRLRELLTAEQAIAFVGAGASAGLYPLWDGLIHQLADEAVKRGGASDADRATWLRIAPRNPQQAVRGIKDSLGRQVYAAVLARVFGYQTGPDGNAFTPVQRLLLELPFRGYVTTNYDPGLLEARSAVRPGVRATGYATWQDADAVRRWQTGEVFGELQACPVLYAHGIYEKSNTIVLGAGEYREAYHPGAFRKLVGKLWSQEQLVFVGFGFTDAWFDVVAEQVLGLTAHQAAGEPRHVAILGLPADELYSPQLREYYRDAYDAEALLYPVQVTERHGIRNEDHGLLRAVLEELRRPFVDQPAGRPPPAEQAIPLEVADWPQRWMHETTEDERYTEPADTLARLDRWVADPRVRAIAITGIGGLGKTALVGHWLKRRRGAAVRSTKGLFGWSFNTDRQVKHFFSGLVEFAINDLGLPPPRRGTRLVDDAVTVIRAMPLVVVLDGLEILQESPGDLTSEEPNQTTYGEFLDDDLRTFLDAACRLSHPGLMVLTSRFPFADLIGFLGSSLRLLPLERLSAAEGAELLGRLDVQGSDQDRQTVSRQLDGHPLALRVLAATVARQASGDPTRLLEVAFAPEEVRDDSPLEAKLQQLLGFYQSQLPDAWQALLGVVALFPDQVAVDTALGLARRLAGVAERLHRAADAQLRGVLAALAADGLLTREVDANGQELYACHPVIRGHFRAALVSQDPELAASAAGLLTGATSGLVETIEELAVVINAIGLLLDAGDIRQADALYRERIGSRPPVFQVLPAPREGVRCALGFVADQDRRDQVRNQLSVKRLSFYLNEVGLYARMSGEFELAYRFYHNSEELDRELGDDHNLSIGLRNRAELLMDLGRLADAEAAAHEAIDAADRSQNDFLKCDVLGWLGSALSLQGHTTEAEAAFDNSNDLLRRLEPDQAGLYSTPSLRYAEHLIRLRRDTEARAVTKVNLTIVEKNDWQDDVAGCHLLLGRLDSLIGAHDTAAVHLAKAAAILRGAYLLPDLIWVVLAQADLDRRRQAWNDAESHVEAALAIASSRRLALQHADALVLRGRINLDRAHTHQTDTSNAQARRAEQALDDAGDASILAHRCGCAWAERDAELLRADAYALLEDAERARAARRQAEQLNRRVQLIT